MPHNFKVLFEDNHLLVVDKPTLLPTMGVSAGEDSLVNQLKVYLKNKYHKPGNVYLGVVSRLDSFVSGIIVFAKTSKAAGRLSEQFRARAPEKIYLAIIQDRAEFDEQGSLTDRIVKNENEHRMIRLDPAAPFNESAQIAELSFRTLGRSSGERLLAIRLKTGRKHQIRVQLASAGCPILGDRKYDSQKNFPSGIALHSYRLSFDHPTQQTVQSFQSEPPAFWRIERFGYDTDSIPIF